MEKLSKYWKLLIFGRDLPSLLSRGEILTPFADFLLGKCRFWRAQRAGAAHDSRRKFEFLHSKKCKICQPAGASIFTNPQLGKDWSKAL